MVFQRTTTRIHTHSSIQSEFIDYVLKIQTGTVLGIRKTVLKSLPPWNLQLSEEDRQKNQVNSGQIINPGVVKYYEEKYAEEQSVTGGAILNREKAFKKEYRT